MPTGGQVDARPPQENDKTKQQGIPGGHAQQASFEQITSVLLGIDDSRSDLFRAVASPDDATNAVAP